MFAGSGFGTSGAIALAGLLVYATASDLRTRRIPNATVLVIAALGVLFTILSRGAAAGGLFSSGGIATGFALWIPFHLLGMLGAGDVKLFAACGAWLGPHGAVEGAALAALAGGVLAVVGMVADGGIGLTFVRMAHAVRDPSALRGGHVSRFRRLPYAVALSIGVLGAAWFPGFLW